MHLKKAVLALGLVMFACDDFFNLVNQRNDEEYFLSL